MVETQNSKVKSQNQKSKLKTKLKYRSEVLSFSF